MQRPSAIRPWRRSRRFLQVCSSTTYGAGYDAVVAPADVADGLSERAVVQGAFWVIAAVPST
jgi:hypothetical protein